MISLSQVHPWKEILQEPEKEEEEKNTEDEKEKEKEREKEEEKEKQEVEDEKDKEEEEEGEEEEEQKEKKEEKHKEKEKEKPVTSGDNDLHDIPDNLLTKLLAIEMETLDTEKERINQETQPGTEGEIFIMR